MSTSGRMAITLFALLCMVPSNFAQPAPAPGLDCTDSLTSLLPCLDYVTDASNNVSAECCTGLSDVRVSAPLCLCAFLGANSADLGINATRAVELPGLCNVDANPADCGAAGTPPVTSPPTAPPTAPVPSTSPAPPATSPSSTTSPPTVTPTAAPPSTTPAVAPPVSPVTPPASEDCSSKIAELTPCLGFVTGQTGPPPSTECCSSFSGVVATAPTCLCSLIDGSSSTGLNATLALQLPTYCNVQVNLADCSGGSTPSTPTAGAPGPSAGLPGNHVAAPVTSSFLTIVLVAFLALQLLH